MAGALDGKVALVTGGSRGIGAAIAIRLATDGADVAISFTSASERASETVAAIGRAGRRGFAVQADQAVAEQARGLVGTVVEHFGRLDILVNNAGVFVTGAVDESDPDHDAFDQQMAINVHGVNNTVRAAAPLLPEGGRIVSVATSGAGTISVPFPGLADYFATKAAIVAYTKGWARDLGPRNITVNAVEPGPIDTEMNPADGESAAVMAAATALGRYGTPEDVAAAVAFLVGPDAAYVTGSALTVDGGRAA
jgi:3-oxoacyl-[acyl-carrier protein] reductase